MKKIIYSKIFIYFLLGIVILILNEYILDYLSYIIGAIMALLALEGLLYDILTKKYKSPHNHIGNSLISLILLLIIIFSERFDLVCIIWGVLSIFKCAKEINEDIYHMVKKEHFILSLGQSIVMLSFSILLITNPLEHVFLHIILLGIEFILESLRRLINVLYLKKYPDAINKMLSERPELEKIYNKYRNDK